ncbi:MAG: hypothetical protein AAF788_03750 [Pseudomonadota bacterium]
MLKYVALPFIGLLGAAHAEVGVPIQTSLGADPLPLPSYEISQETRIILGHKNLHKPKVVKDTAVVPIAYEANISEGLGDFHAPAEVVLGLDELYRSEPRSNDRN